MDARWSGVDPRLYFVTDTGLCARAGRTVAQTVAAAVAGGAGIVQVRDKALDDAAFAQLTRQVLDAVQDATRGSARRVPVVVNDRVAVARQLLDEGRDVHMHVGQGDWPVAEVRRVLGPRPLLGLSAATAAQCAVARASGCVDLIGLSPAFDTATKLDAGAGLGLGGVRALAAQAGLACVALGGHGGAGGGGGGGRGGGGGGGGGAPPPAVLDQIEHLERGGCDRRHQRVGKQIGPRALAQQLDDSPAPARVAAAGAAEGFAQGAGDNINFAHHTTVFVSATPCFAQKAAGMAFVNHHGSIIFVCEFADGIQPGNSAIHAE